VSGLGPVGDPGAGGRDGAILALPCDRGGVVAEREEASRVGGVEHTVKGVAERVGLADRTVRYYDVIGLVSAKRSPSGYRLYGPEHERALCFVRDARRLGFSLDEIRVLMPAVMDRDRGSELAPEIGRLLGRRLDQIDACIGELRALRELLGPAGVLSAADGAPRAERPA